MAIHLLGIRHHGPGSCRNVLNYLQELQPDLILVEGPAEAEALLPCVENSQMTPPVALLAYQPDEPQNAVFYPFAEFSPEWQAMRYAVQNRIPFRFFDLPLVYSLALRTEKTSEQETETTAEVAEAGDPFDWLAHAAGFTDGESWWETMIEHRQEPADPHWTICPK